MKHVIYYPGFEIKNSNWLKFALLYIDELQPIIPRSGDPYLSDSYRQVIHETDLIRPYRLDNEEALRVTLNASRDSYDQVNDILKEPTKYEDFFGGPNFLEKWQNKAYQDFILFREKYTQDWEEFCLNNGLAHRSSKGILLPRELSWLFMSFLAQAIGDASGVSPITDHRELDSLTILSRSNMPKDASKLQIAKKIVALKLPADIEQISLEKIINLRNQPNFKSRLSAFHAELERFLSISAGKLPELDFVRSFDESWKELTVSIVEIGTGVLTVSLAAWVILNNPNPHTAIELIRDVVSPGLSLAVVGSHTINSYWKHSRTSRFCNRYLGDLSNL